MRTAAIRWFDPMVWQSASEVHCAGRVPRVNLWPLTQRVPAPCRVVCHTQDGLAQRHVAHPSAAAVVCAACGIQWYSCSRSNVYAAQGQVKTFADLLRNVFEPLFEATLYPERYPVMAEFLTHICGFDSVDDESKPDRHPFNSQFVIFLLRCSQVLNSHCSSPLPQDWTKADNPSYAYYIYYMFANITSLNQVGGLGRAAWLC